MELPDRQSLPASHGGQFSGERASVRLTTDAKHPGTGELVGKGTWLVISGHYTSFPLQTNGCPLGKAERKMHEVINSKSRDLQTIKPLLLQLRNLNLYNLKWVVQPYRSSSRRAQACTEAFCLPNTSNSK